MKREVLSTADGSKTIRLPEWDEQYHSRHGALAEARHVFIQAGFQHCISKSTEDPIRILEMGFGTGLNAALTLQEARKQARRVQYTGVEAYPVGEEELTALAYWELIGMDREGFMALHRTPWEQPCPLTPSFHLLKRKSLFKEFSFDDAYNLVFFDAFAPRVQPELWTAEQFERLYQNMAPGGVLVTYSAKGSVRRAMQSVGFAVERIPGPPGKRQMLRATRP